MFSFTSGSQEIWISVFMEDVTIELTLGGCLGRATDGKDSIPNRLSCRSYTVSLEILFSPLLSRVTYFPFLGLLP